MMFPPCEMQGKVLYVLDQAIADDVRRQGFGNTLSIRLEKVRSRTTSDGVHVQRGLCRPLNSATQHRRSADTQSTRRIGLQHILSCLYSDFLAERFIAHKHQCLRQRHLG